LNNQIAALLQNKTNQSLLLNIFFLIKLCQPANAMLGTTQLSLKGY